MLTLKTKNRELVDLYNGLQSVKDLPGVKFGLVVSKNIRILQQELNDLEEASKPTEEFSALSAKANGLEKEDLEKLEAENSKLIEERKIQLAELDKLLEEEAEIQLHNVQEDVLPESITAAQITSIDTILS
tara:strand:- start:1831 stop:2223 length:393 start_codon:yes stop_codon:yes gene_type:complete